LALNEASFHVLVLSFVDKTIFFGKFSILRVLEIWVNPSVSNSNTLETHWEIRCVVDQVVGNRGNVMASIGLTGNIELSSFKFRVLGNKSSNKAINTLSNLEFIDIIVSDAVASAESSSNGIVNKKQVGAIVP
jgi:hypothetical protein